MAIAGVLTQAQASDLNLVTSIQQWLFNEVVGPYNTAAAAASLNQGMSMQHNGTWVADTNGLGLMPGMPDDKNIYERVPTLAYGIDAKAVKAPVPTGMGDGSQWEWRSVSVCCLPAISAATDGTIQADRLAQFVLKGVVANAVTRTNIIPIVDRSQAPVSGQYPQIGYAEVHNQQVVDLNKIAQILDANRYRFDVLFDIRWAVQTTN